MVLLDLWRPVPLALRVSESGAGHPQVLRPIPEYLQIHAGVAPDFYDHGRGDPVVLHATHLFDELIIQPQ